MSKIPASLLIIVGIALIAGSGYWFWVDDIKPYLNKNKGELMQKCQDGSFAGEFGKCPEEQSKEAILSVDKNLYQAGEKIIITLRNNSSDAFAYSPYGTGCAAPQGEWWSLQYFDAKNKNWVDITTECRIRYMSCVMPSPEKRSGIKLQLLPGESLTDSYNTGNYNTTDYRGSFCVFGKEGNINFGTFRIKSSFDKKEIYSEPFEIRNLSEKQITAPDHIDGPMPPN